jgi:hypothetical protein
MAGDTEVIVISRKIKIKVVKIYNIVVFKESHTLETALGPEGLPVIFKTRVTPPIKPRKK